ncbi:MAG: DUF4279 domain-containing protein [Isosphaeraceae bacterium]|nr:DUF4279 domain-containing protein [Isosphaeraceae bacterium]
MATEVADPYEEPEYYFRFGATLRIVGDISDLDAITAELGVRPTHSHRRGEKRRPSSLYGDEHDMWSYSAPVPEDRPLQVHLESLWRVVAPHAEYLKRLKERLTVDVFCSYRSNCGTAGFEVDHKSLVIFTELEVPFGISVTL